jgi:hypothetical protein
LAAGKPSRLSTAVGDDCGIVGPSSVEAEDAGELGFVGLVLGSVLLGGVGFEDESQVVTAVVQPEVALEQVGSVFRHQPTAAPGQMELASAKLKFPTVVLQAMQLTMAAL